MNAKNDIAFREQGKKEHGAYLLELTLALPIALLMILVTLWGGLFWDAESALKTSLGRGLRLAATRGYIGVDELGAGVGAIDEIENYPTDTGLA